MHLTKKPFSLYLFLLIANALAILLFVIQPLLSLNWQNLLDLLYQVKTEQIASINNNFNKMFLLNVKILFSRGILLFLTFWISVYILLLIKWKSNEIFFRRLCFGLLAVLLLGTFGIYENHQTKLKAYTPLWPSTAITLHEGDELQQTITFTQFDEKILGFLKRAEAGEIRLSILNQNSANDDPTTIHPTLLIGNLPMISLTTNYLEPQHITELLRAKTLTYKYKIQRDGFFYLYLRAAGKPMTSRRDALTLNNKLIPLVDEDQNLEYLPVVFRFEELSGKPIIAFY